MNIVLLIGGGIALLIEGGHFLVNGGGILLRFQGRAVLIEDEVILPPLC